MTDIIKRRFAYKQDLTEILLKKIQHYELISPLEYTTFHNIERLEKNLHELDDEAFNIQVFRDVFNDQFSRQLQQMRDEPIKNIKEELKEKRLDLDNILSQNATMPHQAHHHQHNYLNVASGGGDVVP